jgi:hypothetical protein
MKRVTKGSRASEPTALGNLRLRSLRQRRLAQLTAKRAKKRAADWSIKLTRSLTMQDGAKLVTLADAREILVKCFETLAQSAPVALAMERVMTAAETGTFADRKAATDQVALVLRRRLARRS